MARQPRSTPSIASPSTASRQESETSCGSVRSRSAPGSADFLASVFRELLDHIPEVRVAPAEENTANGVPTPRGNGLAVCQHIELTRLARWLQNGVDVQALLDQGSETRRLIRGAASRSAILDVDLHSGAEATTVPLRSLLITCAAAHYRAGSCQIRSRQSQPIHQLINPRIAR